MVVDPYDDAFYHPTKVIGRVMNAEDAELEERKGNHVVEVPGGYRRIMAAPKPLDIIEAESIRALLEADQVVIACGGGGIPVLRQGNSLKGASAIIEKDLAAARLACAVDADLLLILTGVQKVCLRYGTAEEAAVDEMTVSEARSYLEAGEFEAGSMAPKIEAAVDFIGASERRKAVVTRLEGEEPDRMIAGGTVIHR